MKAGRELDGQVAEKVMGCKPIHTHEYGLYPKEGWLICRCKGNVHSKASKKRGYSEEIQSIPAYSTNFADVWDVVEEITDFGFALEHLGSGEWAVNLMCVPNGGEIDVIAKTVPLAICLAALKVVEEKI